MQVVSADTYHHQHHTPTTSCGNHNSNSIVSTAKCGRANSSSNQYSNFPEMLADINISNNSNNVHPSTISKTFKNQLSTALRVYVPNELYHHNQQQYGVEGTVMPAALQLPSGMLIPEAGTNISSGDGKANQKVFNCPLCAFTANRAAKVDIHMRSHTGERPYPCTVCDYRAIRKDHLQVHLLRHAAAASSSASSVSVSAGSVSASTGSASTSTSVSAAITAVSTSASVSGDVHSSPQDKQS